MRRLATAITIVLTAAALGAIGMRLTGPRVRPLPQGLPHVVRNPPPLRAELPQPRAGVNPGEDVVRLHANGITGRNIGIAIIDRPLLTQHREFASRLRWYDEIDTEPDEPAGWHSTAVASIAAGRTVGVAPEADLYFVGVGMIWNGEPLGNWFAAARHAVHFGQALPLAISRIMELDRRLPPERRIRAISISVGGGGALLQAIDEARRQGIFVSAVDLQLPPLGPVSIASPTGPDAYTSHATPAGSWAIAHMAGRYALACQIDPATTPEKFLRQMNLQIHR